MSRDSHYGRGAAGPTLHAPKNTDVTRRDAGYSETKYFQATSLHCVPAWFFTSTQLHIAGLKCVKALYIKVKLSLCLTKHHVMKTF